MSLRGLSGVQRPARVNIDWLKLQRFVVRRDRRLQLAVSLWSIAQVVVRWGIVRLAPYGLTVFLDRLIVLALYRQRVSKIVVFSGVGIVGLGAIQYA